MKKPLPRKGQIWRKGHVRKEVVALSWCYVMVLTNRSKTTTPMTRLEWERWCRDAVLVKDD